MKRKGFWLAVVFFCLRSGFAMAEEPQKNTKISGDAFPQLYIRGSVGAHVVPQFLLQIGADKSPDRLWGVSSGVSAGYSFNKKYSLGLSFFYLDVSGKGPFSNGEDLSSYGVAGAANGKLRLNMWGIGLEAERRFWLTENLAWYVRLGPLGVGFVGDTFDGTFDGHFLFDPAQKIHEPAQDKSEHIVPLLGLGTGLEWQLNRNWALEAGPYWNTGVGGQVNTVARFNLPFDF